MSIKFKFKVRIELIPEGKTLPISVRTYTDEELVKAIEYIKAIAERVDANSKKV